MVGATPAELADRAGRAARTDVLEHGESQPEARPGRERDLPKVIDAHQLDGLPAEDAMAVKLPLVQDHLQEALFFPDEDLMVVVVAGGGTPCAGCTNPSALSLPLSFQYILPAVLSSSALPPNPAGVARLAAEMAAAGASYEGMPQPVPPLPATASAISGRRFVLDANPLRIEYFSLTFEAPAEATLNIVGEEEVTFQIGLDDVPRISVGEHGLPAAAKGWWADGSRLVVLLDEFAIVSYLRVTLQLAGNQVTATLEDLACPGGPQVVITGTMQPG
jgi:hypothetical protein